MTRIGLLWSYIRLHRVSYAFGVLFIVATNLIAVTIPEYIQRSIDLVGSGEDADLDQLFNLVSWILLLAVGMVVVRTMSRILFFNPGRAIECELKNEMFTKLTMLQKDYYDSNSTGSIISRINNDITGVRLLCGFAMMQTFNIISALSLTPVKMYQLSPGLTLGCVIPIIFLFGVVRMGMRVLVASMRERQSTLQEMSGYTISALSGIEVIKGHGMGGLVRGQFDKLDSNLLNLSLKVGFIRSFIMSLLANLENILKTLILLVGGGFVISADFTIGELTAFMSYAALLTMPLMALGWVSTMIQQGMVGVDSILTILTQETPSEDRKDLTTNEREHLFDDGLEVRGLNFSYEDAVVPALTDISFKIMPGQTLGVLGRIGSGKSTLVNCLNQYSAPGPGMVFLDGKDVAELSQQDLRRCVRTVTQEPFLFSDTVAENVQFGLPHDHPDEKLSSEELWTVLRESAMDEEVQRFPKQESTVVGEKGIMLSGGQKQRISLARALTSPCDLLIMDNVLSAVDYDTERFLLDQIYQRNRARSLMIVSHRATALEKADTIIVLEEGKIVDRGTHEELVARPGYYQETYNLQSQD